MHETQLIRTIRSLADSQTPITSTLALHDALGVEAPLNDTTTITRDDRGSRVTREISVGSFSGGGALLPSEVNRVAAALRPFSVVLRLGAQVINVSGAATIPTKTQGATASWLSETGEVSESSVTFGTLNLAPHRVSALLRVSKQLIVQAPAVAEAVLRRDVLVAIGQALDVASLSGLGGVEPLGILYNPNIPAPVTFSGPPTLADACLLESTLAVNFGEGDAPAFVSSPATRSKWRQTESVVGSGVALWVGDTVLGHPAYASACVSNDQIVFGNFADFIIAMWGSVTIISDPFAGKKTGQVELVVNLMADVGALRNKSFAMSTDSGAQN